MDLLRRGISQTNEGQLDDYDLLQSVLTLRARIDSLINTIGCKLKILEGQIKNDALNSQSHLLEGDESIMKDIIMVMGTLPDVNQISNMLPNEFIPLQIRLKESFKALKRVYNIIEDFEEVFQE